MSHRALKKRYGRAQGAIKHPSVDGNYNTEREAGVAIRRFLGA